MRALLPLCLCACGGPATLPPVDQAPLCRQLAAAPTGTFGCSADQLPEGGPVRYRADLHFRADGTLERFTDLQVVRERLADAAPPAPDCVVDELRGWRLEGLPGAIHLPITLVYEPGPTDFREAVADGDTCRVQITLQNP